MEPSSPAESPRSDLRTRLRTPTASATRSLISVSRSAPNDSEKPPVRTTVLGS
jgi:hypothetical protein